MNVKTLDFIKGGAKVVQLTEPNDVWWFILVVVNVKLGHCHNFQAK